MRRITDLFSDLGHLSDRFVLGLDSFDPLPVFR
jgi:hypothetical protein